MRCLLISILSYIRGIFTWCIMHMDLQICLGLPKYTNRFTWELAVTFNRHSHAREKTRKVVPNACGILILIIFESMR